MTTIRRRFYIAPVEDSVHYLEVWYKGGNTWYIVVVRYTIGVQAKIGFRETM